MMRNGEIQRGTKQVRAAGNPLYYIMNMCHPSWIMYVCFCASIAMGKLGAYLTASRSTSMVQTGVIRVISPYKCMFLEQFCA